MRIPVLDGPAKGVIATAPDLPQGFRPSGFRWTMFGTPGEDVDYTAYRVKLSNGRYQWVFALDENSVQRYTWERNCRIRRTWKFHARTKSGDYCFRQDGTYRYHTVSLADFWRTDGRG